VIPNMEHKLKEMTPGGPETHCHEWSVYQWKFYLEGMGIDSLRASIIAAQVGVELRHRIGEKEQRIFEADDSMS